MWGKNQPLSTVIWPDYVSEFTVGLAGLTS